MNSTVEYVIPTDYVIILFTQFALHYLKFLNIKRMAAKMRFIPGDIIQEFEEPFIKYLNISCKKSLCHYCFKSNYALRRCSGCKMVCYCNLNCQKLDWKKAHSIECKLFANPQIASIAAITKVTDYMDVIFKVIRTMCVLKLHDETATKSYLLWDGSSR